MVGFYFIRDNIDTGRYNNPLGLPAGKYELAYVIQDKMFKSNGELFFPSMPNDPEYDGFINGEGAVLPPAQFQNGGLLSYQSFSEITLSLMVKYGPKQTLNQDITA